MFKVRVFRVLGLRVYGLGYKLYRMLGFGV